MPGMGVVVHVGRKTGRVYRTPVLVFQQGDRFVIALTYGRESEWVRNVVAQGGCELEAGGHRLRLTNPHLYRDERRRAVPGFVRIMLGVLNVSDFLELTVQEKGMRIGHHEEESNHNASRRSA
jgi:deazaflavin-dependent oxidoreductase (nitroreductase family)